ncbi:MAG: hypothetical protein SFU98_20090 [Leptospiraceae bacterium]|nr:hypothetical protein [Leptospiraceae bacterium]
MDTIIKKMNFKDQKTILALNAPIEFEENLTLMQKIATIDRKILKAKKYEFLIAFVKTQKQLDDITNKIQSFTYDDTLVWFAYPKLSSKKYKSEINRDQGWQALGDIGYEGVRMVAIDEDWSALRFKKANRIKKLTRSSKLAMSKEGKSRVSK